MILVAALVVLIGAGILREIDKTGIVTVPNEVGKKRPAAVTQISDAGLVATVTTERPESHPTAPPLTVVSQSPAPGVQVRPGRAVNLRIEPAAPIASSPMTPTRSRNGD